MKKWLTHTTIAVYLTALSWGIVSHTLSYGATAHPVMYYFVWDMFCGWTSYESRMVIVGQGESGKYYQLAPGPWGEIRPYGRIGRRHYDPSGTHSPRFALNTLRHTQHEPIARIIVVEECWAKQYNLPDRLWNERFEEPKVPHKYYQVRHIYSPDGQLAKSYPNWMSLQYSIAVSDNPRLMQDRRNNQPFFALQRKGSAVTPTFTNIDYQDALPHTGSRLGNGN
jgi:hypothetical protein